MADIEYVESLEGISPAMLQGFFEGWLHPHPPDQHLGILKNSAHVVLAVDRASEQVVGFVTAVTDGVQSAFIPMLEVLPHFRGQGIGTRLTLTLLDKLKNVSAIDLMCDEPLQSFYERFGLRRAVGMSLRRGGVPPSS